MEFDLKKRKKYLHSPVKPLKIETGGSVSSLLRKMGETAFQGKNLALAADVWEKMLRTRNLVFFGLAGAMVPAGMRQVIVYLIKNRFIDCLVSTGANLFHDVHETMGWHHWQGSAAADDRELREAGLDRMYDVYGVDDEFNVSDKFIYEFARTLERRPYTTREFLNLLGGEMSRKSRREGILTSAFKAGVHVYCPAIADSSLGIALAMEDGPGHFVFDLIGDVKETAHLTASQPSGVVYVGGGTPKNFIQQAEVTADMMCRRVSGHRHAVQITADAPHWGGLSGCTFEEAQSWGKIAKKSTHVSVFADATIALPIITTALAERMEGVKRAMPRDVSFKNAYRVKKRLFD